MPRIKNEEIARQMLPVLSQDTVLFTDAFRGFKPVTKSAGIKRITRNQNKGEHSRGVYHIQNLNAGPLFVSNPKLIHYRNDSTFQRQLAKMDMCVFIWDMCQAA
jgi:hypothetical protein